MEYYTTIGLDVSDKTTQVCVMTKTPDGGRHVVLETKCATTKDGFEETFAKLDRSWPVVFETGTHCRWMDATFRALGFKTIVANPCKVPSITKSNTKNDRNDARELARLAIADVGMLHPVKLRAEVYQQMLRLHGARQLLIKTRTSLVNQMRGFGKSVGFRIVWSSTETFHEQPRKGWPEYLEAVVAPLMKVLKEVNAQIEKLDWRIAELAEDKAFKPMVDRCREVYGVAINGATVFVAAIGGDVGRFSTSRDVGAYLGLTPRQDQSGETDKQLGITHAGLDIVRKVLVECANVVTKTNAKDTDLKYRGMRIAQSGGRIARKKAKIAVARGLGVTMAALLMNPSAKYVPLSEENRRALERFRADQAMLEAAEAKQKADRKAKKAAKKAVAA